MAACYLQRDDSALMSCGYTSGSNTRGHTLEQAMLEKAYTPLKVGPVTLPNRFIKAGANENMSLQGMPTRAMLKHHEGMAAGGWA